MELITSAKFEIDSIKFQNIWGQNWMKAYYRVPLNFISTLTDANEAGLWESA